MEPAVLTARKADGFGFRPPWMHRGSKSSSRLRKGPASDARPLKGHLISKSLRHR